MSTRAASGEATTYLLEETQLAEVVDFVAELARRGAAAVPEPKPALVGADGRRVEVPGPVFDALVQVATAMAHGQGVIVIPQNSLLTTQEAAELLGAAQVELVKRAGLDPGEVEQIVGGCVTQAGEQASNVTRTAWLSQGLPYEVAATTVDCQCGSAQQANNFVANLISADAIHAGIACGVEAMSRVGLGANAFNGPGKSRPDRFPWDMPDQFNAAERIAQKYGIARVELPLYRYRRHRDNMTNDKIAWEHYEQRLREKHSGEPL